jgi:predicted amidohydrolase
VGRFGISICYDMWFPETTRTLAWMGAEVILHPTMTGTIDRDPETSIARASAITNQVYFFDINGAGSIGNGRSIIVGPEGNVIHQAGSGREIIPVQIDLQHLRRTRENGLMNLGQPLKSFRDHWRTFPQYQPGAKAKTFQNLGALEKPSARIGR